MLRQVIIGNILGNEIRLFWPEGLITDTIKENPITTHPNHYSRNSWWFCRRNHGFLGVYCSAETYIDYSLARDSEIQVSYSFICNFK